MKRVPKRGLALALMSTLVFVACGTPQTDGATKSHEARGGSDVLPTSPIRQIAFGRFNQKRWALFLWKAQIDGSGNWNCSLVGRRKSVPKSHTCTRGYDPDDFMSSNQSMGNEKDRTMFVGTALKEVRSITAELKNGTSIPVTIIPSPNAVRSPHNYYVAYFPLGATGTRIARDKHGKVLEREKLLRNSNR